MNHAIKKYSHVHEHDEKISFRISRMEDIYDERSGEPDVPHRHDYYTVLLVTDATGDHMIDFHTYQLTANQLFFIAPGQVHQVIEKRRSTGFVILFSPDFLVENNIPVSFINDLNLFSGCGETPPIDLSQDELKKLGDICSEMMQISLSEIKFKNVAIGSYLKLFLIQSNNLCTLDFDNPQRQEAGNTILKGFRSLVEENYSIYHAAQEYAELLNVTPDHLNKVISSLLGKSAKEYIQDRIILAAKRMLYFTDLSAKEISYELGFSEPANFSAFFKKETGISPSMFREKNI